MICVDTETTGLYLQHGCTAFSIGVYDGNTFTHSTVPVSPRSRARTCSHTQEIKDRIRSAETIVMHNARFDIKALCEAGVFSWDDPVEPAFWRRVIDTIHLAHLHNSTDRLSLDNLTALYLEKEYPQEDELVTTVNLCRALVRKLELDWDIAREDGEHCSFRMCGSNTEWNRMDYWLPAAVLESIPVSLRPNLPNARLSRVLLEYLQADVTNTFELAQFFFHQILVKHGDKSEELLNINRQLDHVLWKMEYKGVWLRSQETRAAIESCYHYINHLKQECLSLSGLDRLTDTTIRILLFENWSLPVVSQTKKGNYSVNAETLLRLHRDAEPDSTAYRFLGSYLSLKKYEKKLQFLQSYLNNRTGKGHLHPSFHASGTNTTRFSSSNPNIQQVTKAGNPYEDDAPYVANYLRKSPSLRSCFGPAPGHWWLDCDYSQLQLRIFAYVANEQGMIDAFNKGWDAHDYVARCIFSLRDTETPTKAQRRIAKNVNFGFIFGASPKKIEQTAGIRGLWSTVTSLFPNAHAFIEETKAYIQRHGLVYTVGGYPLALKDYLNKHTGEYEKAAHAGVNYIVQGAEGVIVKRAMRLCDDYLTSEYPEGRIVLQCHDELVFEFPAYFPKKHVWNIVNLMEQAASEYGIHAPVDPELCTQSWNKSVKVQR